MSRNSLLLGNPKDYYNSDYNSSILNPVLNYCSLIQFRPLQSIIVISTELFSHPCHSSGIFLWYFQSKNVCISHFPHVNYMSCRSRLPWFINLYSIRRIVQIMKSFHLPIISSFLLQNILPNSLFSNYVPPLDRETKFHIHISNR